MMKNMKRNLLRTMVSFFCLTGLFACGGSSSAKASASGSSAQPTSESVEQKYTVNFNYNYESAGIYKTSEVKAGEKVAQPEDPTRENYTFLAWTSDAAGENAYDFGTAVNANLELYAQWVDGNTKLYTITYHYGYEDKTSTQKIQDGKRLTTQTPERENYVFMGWFTDEAFTTKFSNGSKVSSDLDLYGKWGKTYVMEAEYVDLSNFHGQGFSGGCDGVQAISQDKAGLGASNGVFLTYMYNNGLSISFNFTSTGAENDGKLYLRLSCEKMSITVKSSEFTVSLNGSPLSYADISLTEDQNFADYVISDSCKIQEGDNTLTLTTTNSNAMAGTMYSTAPIIDCAKFVSSTELVMDAHTDNMNKFNMD